MAADGEGFFDRAGYPALNAFSYFAGMTVALAAPGRRDWRRAWLSLTLPLYWPLQSLAMIRALYGLAKCPHFWAKTPHTVRSQAAWSVLFRKRNVLFGFSCRLMHSDAA